MKLMSYCFAVNLLLVCPRVFCQPKPPDSTPRRPKGPGKNPPGNPKTLAVAATIQITNVNPVSPSAGHPIDVSYTVSNSGLLGTLTGLVSGNFQGEDVVIPTGGKPQPVAIAPKMTLSGAVRISLPRTGTARLTLGFEQQPVCTNRPIGPSGKPIQVCQHNVYAQTSVDITVTPDLTSQDLDLDGIPDALEDALLAKYRPYYRFSNDGGEEPERPADPLWYIRHSTLLTDGDENSTPAVGNDVLSANPAGIITSTAAAGFSNFQAQRCKTNYFINPANDYRSGFFNGDGTDWPQLVNAGGLGQYGHVARDPDQLNLYRIEYWQFYGYNRVDVKTSGVVVNAQVEEHEGDWEVITVVVDSMSPLTYPVAVVHYVHGDPIKFSSISAALKRQYTSGQPAAPAAAYELGSIDIGQRLLLHGARWDQVSASLDAHDDGDLAKMQDSVLELYCAPVPNQPLDCTHPVVYVEWGTHASWPTPKWGFIGAPSHNGAGTYHYLAAPPPNLGEDLNPRATTSGAQVVLNFNGHWGAFQPESASHIVFGYFAAPGPGTAQAVGQAPPRRSGPELPRIASADLTPGADSLYGQVPIAYAAGTITGQRIAN